jgi:hypothetical protein
MNVTSFWSALRPVDTREPSKGVPELWDRAIVAYESFERPNGETVERALLDLARQGHPNAVTVLDGLLEDVTGCTCGADEPCADDIDPPERVEYRAALTALLEAMRDGR